MCLYITTTHMRSFRKCEATLYGRCGQLGMCIKGVDPSWDGKDFSPKFSQDLTNMDDHGWYCYDCMMCPDCYEENQDNVEALLCDETLE